MAFAPHYPQVTRGYAKDGPLEPATGEYVDGTAYWYRVNIIDPRYGYRANVFVHYKQITAYVKPIGPIFGVPPC